MKTYIIILLLCLNGVIFAQNNDSLSLIYKTFNIQEDRISNDRLKLTVNNKLNDTVEIFFDNNLLNKIIYNDDKGINNILVVGKSKVSREDYQKSGFNKGGDELMPDDKYWSGYSYYLNDSLAFDIDTFYNHQLELYNKAGIDLDGSLDSYDSALFVSTANNEFTIKYCNRLYWNEDSTINTYLKDAYLGTFDLNIKYSSEYEFKFVFECSELVYFELHNHLKMIRETVWYKVDKKASLYKNNGKSYLFFDDDVLPLSNKETLVSDDYNGKLKDKANKFLLKLLDSDYKGYNFLLPFNVISFWNKL